MYPRKPESQIKEKISKFAFLLLSNFSRPFHVYFATERCNSLKLHPHVQRTELIVSSLYFRREQIKQIKQTTCPWNWDAPDGVADAFRWMKPSTHRSLHMTETEGQETWRTFASSTERKAPIPTVLKIYSRTSCKYKHSPKFLPPSLYSQEKMGSCKCVPMAPRDIFKGNSQNWHSHLHCRGNFHTT